MHILVRTADCRRFLEDYDGAQEVYEHSKPNLTHGSLFSYELTVLCSCFYGFVKQRS